MDADGMALAFWVCLGLFVLLVAAGGVEWFLTRPSRRWLRRLQELERARVDWQARVVREQCFYGSEK
jgi:peptidoglycan/LPS O-acetylase OafA/YrhL